MENLFWVGLVIVFFIIGTLTKIKTSLLAPILTLIAYLLFEFFNPNDEIGLWFWIIQTVVLSVPLTLSLFTMYFAKHVMNIPPGVYQTANIGIYVGLVLHFTLLPGLGLVIAPVIAGTLAALGETDDFFEALGLGFAGTGLALVRSILSKILSFSLNVFSIILFFIWIAVN